MNNNIPDKSKLWEKLELRFINQGGLNGYGINPNSNLTIYKIYMYLVWLLDIFFSPLKILNYLINQVYQKLFVLLSLIFYKDSKAHIKYGFLKYKSHIYDKELVSEFKVKCHSIGFSHNSLKVFSYIKILESQGFFELFNGRRIKILEIGPGAFNMAKLLLEHRQGIDYVSIDLPEIKNFMLKNFSSLQINATLTPYSYVKTPVATGNTVTMLSTNEMNLLRGNFDLFINTESFSEMDIGNVNRYLKLFKSHSTGQSAVFLVNRLMRIQSFYPYKEEDIEKITYFKDYNLSEYKTKYLKLDMFRNRIPNEGKHPNFIYYGIQKNDGFN